LEQEKTWQVVPRIECIRHLKENLPRGSVIGDFGCGQGKLAETLIDFHIVHSFDHIAIHPGVVACDIAHTPLDDGSLDAVVFSLSLMGSNINEYIDEAYRVLKLGGQVIIWHPAKHNDRSHLVEGLRRYGFAIVEEGQIYKWHHIWAIKQARKKVS
jgi:ribosomal RNA-processing protein 8